LLTGYFYLVVPTTPLWAVTSTDGSWVRVTRGQGVSDGCWQRGPCGCIPRLCPPCLKCPRPLESETLLSLPCATIVRLCSESEGPATLQLCDDGKAVGLTAAIDYLCLQLNTTDRGGWRHGCTERKAIGHRRHC
jgi:hypothetical protein